MAKAQPGYYAVLSANVRYDKGLSSLEKILFAEVTALCNKEGYCYAGNDYFAGLYDKSEGHVSRMLSRLAKRKYIEIDLDRSEQQGTKRYIYLCPTTTQKCEVEVQPRPTTTQKCEVHSLLITNNIKHIEQNESALPSHFDKIWEQYPRKLGKEHALRRYKASCKTQPDRDAMDKALENYLKHLSENTWKGPMHGKTWFGEWRDWIEYREEQPTAPGKVIDERRERIKDNLKSLYKRKQRQEGYLEACAEQDERSAGIEAEIKALTEKIQKLEGALHV